MEKILRSLALASLISSAAMAAQQFDVPEGNLLVPHQMSSVSALRYDSGNFFLTRDGVDQQVARYNVRGVPGVPETKIEELLTSDAGYFRVGGSVDEPMLQWNGRIKGGVIISWLLGCDKKEIWQNSLSGAALGGMFGGGWGAVAGGLLADGSQGRQMRM